MTHFDKISLSALLWMPRGNEIPGGHAIQLRSTAAALEQLGVRVDICTDDQPEFRRADIVHGFGLHAREIHSIRSEGCPVVLSTIYWDRSYRVDQSNGALSPAAIRRRSGMLLRSTVAALKGPVAYIDWAAEVLRGELSLISAYEAADLLLPNSDAEASSIRRDLDVSTPCHVVPNAVSPERIGVCTDVRSNERASVLYVGRIDPHKNQLGLIEALKGTELPLTIVGYEHPHHSEYAYRCRKAGDGWVEFAPGTPDVGPHYRHARVHAIPSWFETTGLVSLEAAIAGCNIVSTSRGHAKAYLGDLAWYCDPGSKQSIRSAVLAAWEAPEQSALRDHVLANFTWDHTARATLDGYTQVVTSRRR